MSAAGEGSTEPLLDSIESYIVHPQVIESYIIQ